MPSWLEQIELLLMVCLLNHRFYPFDYKTDNTLTFPTIGDTANKIGTYNLALSAKHHNIPFFVAAPLTSIDLSLPSGESIVIEERSPKELLNTRGGLGEQVAASGISVWNPAFDVTPANLIDGIITEKVCLVLSCLVGSSHCSSPYPNKVANLCS